MTPDFLERHSWRLYPLRHWLFWLPMLGIALLYQFHRVTGADVPLTPATQALALLFILSITLSVIASLFPTGRGSLSPRSGQPRSRALTLRRWVTTLVILFVLAVTLQILVMNILLPLWR